MTSTPNATTTDGGAPGCAAPGWHGGRRPRIGLIGNFGTGNFGNDASLEAMARMLRSDIPDAVIVAICPEPRVVEQQLGLPAVAMRPGGAAGRWHRLAQRATAGLPSRLAAWRDALTVTRSLDAVIVPGTGILDDYGTGPQGVPYALFRWCLAARAAGARIAFVSIGAGPIHHPASRWLMASAARLAHVRSYRDRPSQAFMAGLGFDVARDGLAPDLAFSLPVPSPVIPAPRADRPAEPAPRVALGVMNYKGWSGAAESVRERYLDRMADLARRLLERRYRLVLIQGDDADAAAVAALRSRLSGLGGNGEVDRIETPPAASLAAVLPLVASSDVVVSSRFHNLVAAHMVGRPTISLGYAEKNTALQEQMGLGAFCHDIMEFDADRVVAQVGELVGDRERHGERIRAVVAQYRFDLDRQQTALVDALRARVLPSRAGRVRAHQEAQLR